MLGAVRRAPSLERVLVLSASGFKGLQALGTQDSTERVYVLQQIQARACPCDVGHQLGTSATTHASIGLNVCAPTLPSLDPLNVT